MRGFWYQNTASESRRYVPIMDDGLVALVMNTEGMRQPVELLWMSVCHRAAAS